MDWVALQFIAVIVLALYAIKYQLPPFLKRWRAFKAWEQEQEDLESAGGVAAWNMPLQPLATAHDLEPVSKPSQTRHIDPTPLPGAGMALANPPRDLKTIFRELKLQDAVSNGEYVFPLGWTSIKTDVSLVFAGFVGDTNHVLATGFTDSGKDTWAAQALLSLALQYTPKQLQIAIIDGKGGLSWIGWGTKAHVSLFAKKPEDIAPAMEHLQAERERRQEILEQHRCKKWEQYEGDDLPLLVVYVSELMLLQDAVGKTGLGDWLNTELTSARAAGIRYIISGQTVTRMDMRWRSQIGLYVAGYQPNTSQDEPNTSFTTNQLRELGTEANGTVVGLPPSELPVPPEGAGVFTCVQGRTVITVRSTYLTDEEEAFWLEKLPEKSLHNNGAPRPTLKKYPISSPDHDYLLAMLRSGASLLEPETSDVAPDVAPTKHPSKEGRSTFEAPRSTFDDVGVSDVNLLNVALPIVDVETVPLDEQKRIIEAAQTSNSRGKLCQELYGTRGGHKYQWIRHVCDAAGLLTQERSAA